MRGIILVGHGSFGTGLTSSLDLITGRPENYYYHDFLQDISQEDLTNTLQTSIDQLSRCDEILIATDIVGGTPFKTAVMLALGNSKLTVVSGVNLPFLLSVHFGLMDDTTPISEIVDATINEARDSLFRFDPESFQ